MNIPPKSDSKKYLRPTIDRFYNKTFVLAYVNVFEHIFEQENYFFFFGDKQEKFFWAKMVNEMIFFFFLKKKFILKTFFLPD